MPIIHRSPAPWLPWLLGTISLVALLSLFASSPVLVYGDPRISIIFIALVAFVVNVEVPLVGDSISLGYAAGLMVYLILRQPENDPEVFVIIAVGALLGGALRSWWVSRMRGFSRRTVEWPIMGASQLTLSIFGGDVAYRLLDGRLPLTTLHLVDALPVLALIMVSGLIYLGLYALSLWWRAPKPRQILERNRTAIILAMTVPIPLVIAAALIYPLARGGFTLLIAGLVGMAIGATELGRGQLRYREQLLEVQSLSTVSRAVRTHLDLDILLEMVQLQVATLLEIDTFVVALYDAGRNLVSFPLAARHSRRLTIPSRELGMDVIDHVIVTKAPLLLEQNPSLRARAMALIPPEGTLTSWLGVPLIAPDRALGCLAIATEDPLRRFSERDLRLLTSIAAQSSMAIENPQLYQH